MGGINYIVHVAGVALYVIMLAMCVSYLQGKYKLLSISNCKGVSINMKSTGIVRRVDPLGRVLIPKELRRTLGIAEKDGLEIFMDSDKIIFQKYEPACIFCGSADEIEYYKGKIICGECFSEMIK